MENNVRQSSVPRHLADIFALPLYQKVQPHFLSSQQHTYTYTDNATFWQDAFAKRHFQLMRLQLKNFHLMEWLPSAPGRYFTDTACLSRKMADADIHRYSNEYGPRGKSQMIRGGMGSFRLGPRHFDGIPLYFLGATSTGISHEGIPVILNECDYQAVIPHISRFGGCLADLEGTLQILQMSQPSTKNSLFLFYDPGTPRYCFVLEHLHLHGPSPEVNLIATAAIAFSHKHASTPLHKYWAFASFHPGRNGGLDDAVHWLQNYAERHSGTPDPRILADFDEHYQHFTCSVEFALQQVAEQIFDVPRAIRYQHLYQSMKSKKPFSPRIHQTSLTQCGHNPVRTLLCFAPSDELFAEPLKASLAALRRKGYIDLSVESEVLAGSERVVELERELEQTQLILMLLSPDLIANNYYYNEVIPRTLQLHEQQKAKVVMIYVRPTLYEGLPLEDLPILPENAVPINDPSWKSTDHALHEIVEKLQEIIVAMVR